MIKRKEKHREPLKFNDTITVAEFDSLNILNAKYYCDGNSKDEEYIQKDEETVD